MATYPKKLKTLEIHLVLDGQTVNFSDTADDDKASRMLNDFVNYKDMVVEVESGTEYIPYHAVQYIKVTEADGEAQKADPYGCEA